MATPPLVLAVRSGGRSGLHRVSPVRLLSPQRVVEQPGVTGASGPRIAYFSHVVRERAGEISRAAAHQTEIGRTGNLPTSVHTVRAGRSRAHALAAFAPGPALAGCGRYVLGGARVPRECPESARNAQPRTGAARGPFSWARTNARARNNFRRAEMDCKERSRRPARPHGVEVVKIGPPGINGYHGAAVRKALPFSCLCHTLAYGTLRRCGSWRSRWGHR